MSIDLDLTVKNISIDFSEVENQILYATFKTRDLNLSAVF
jgi:hypothetical protein